MKTILIIVSALLMMPLGVNAQKKSKKATKAKTTKVVAPAEPTPEDINFDNLLPSTAKVVFVDSQIVKRQSLVKSIPLAKSAGTIEVAVGKKSITYSYTNSLATNRIVSRTDAEGHNHLYRETKQGTGWSKPEKLNIPGNFTDMVAPYLMADGSTLYFAAKGGEENLGGYDIFFTIYDNEEDKFVMPQSIGLPFNSSADDIYYIIDEDYNLGHLVTSRRLSVDSLCIYTFVPSDSREMYDGVEEEKLRAFAMLNSIKDTQKGNAKIVAEANARLAKSRLSTASKTADTSFPIKAGVTYHKREDFKVLACHDKFATYCQRMSTLNDKEERLAALRKGFHNGQTYTKDEILKLEKEIEQERFQLRTLETEIRNLELNIKK